MDNAQAAEPEKTLFILKAKADSLTHPEAYLKTKGWNIQSATSLKDAIRGLLVMRPKYILICMDHPNSKVKMLPKLLETALGAKVIAFLDSVNSSTIDRK